jgi:hypothetical protein
MSSRLWSSADLDAMIERVTPDLLALLQDGVPRTRTAIIAALVARHSRDEIKRTLARLDVLGQLEEQGGKYRLGSAPEADQGSAKGVDGMPGPSA